VDESRSDLAGNQISRDELLSRIGRLRPSAGRAILLAIDGRGASGKSSLAEAVAKNLRHVTVVHTDDLALNRGWDWQRLQEQVLEPIINNQQGRYQRYDWDTGGMAEWHDVPVGGLLILEGVYSMRRELGDIWDLTIWVECAKPARLNRALERDGKEMMPTWINVWEVQEDRYVKEQSPDKRADVIIDGTAPL
jgi:uridine kinase